MAEILEISRFSGREGETFRVAVEGRDPIDLTLAAVVDRGSERCAPEGPRSFSLEFRGAPDLYLPQRIYRLEHPDLGHLEMFLVPVGPDKKGQLFESLFNYDSL